MDLSWHLSMTQMLILNLIKSQFQHLFLNKMLKYNPLGIYWIYHLDLNGSVAWNGSFFFSLAEGVSLVTCTAQGKGKCTLHTLSTHSVMPPLSWIY